MPSKRVSSLFFAGVCLPLAFASPMFGQAKGQKGGASRAIVTINDASGGAGVYSDGTDGSSVYTDSKIPGGDPCVTAIVQADGFFQIQMDYSPDVGSDCNAMGQADPPRSYKLRFPGTHAACTQFGLTATMSGVCILVLDPNTDQPIIGIPKLFSASLSQVRFRFRRWNGSSYNYWVVALTNVPVDQTQNPQTVTHVGEAKLFNDDKGKSGGYQVGGAFTFALEITVDKRAP